MIATFAREFDELLAVLAVFQAAEGGMELKELFWATSAKILPCISTVLTLLAPALDAAPGAALNFKF